MKKTIKHFALFPVRVNNSGLCYTIWLTHYYMEYTSVEKLIDTGEQTQTRIFNGCFGSQGSVTLTYEWELTDIYQ